MKNEILLIMPVFRSNYFVSMITMSLAYGQFQSEIMEPNKTETEYEGKQLFPEKTEEEKIAQRERFYANNPDIPRPENLSSSYYEEQQEKVRGLR